MRGATRYPLEAGHPLMPSVNYTRPKIPSNATSTAGNSGAQERPSSSNWGVYGAVILVAAAIYLACIVSPPSLQDDVDAVQAQIARNMITSGDWVTPRLDGIIYLEKPPLIYWMMAVTYQGLRRARLGGTNSCRALGDRAVLAHRRVRHLGIRQAGRVLCRHVHGDVRRIVAVHACAHPRRDTDPNRRPGNVGVAPSAGRGRTPSASVGIHPGRKSRHWPPA